MPDKKEEDYFVGISEPVKDVAEAAQAAHHLVLYGGLCLGCCSSKRAHVGHCECELEVCDQAARRVGRE